MPLITLLSAYLVCALALVYHFGGRILGSYLRRRTAVRRQNILAQVEAERLAFKRVEQSVGPKSGSSGDSSSSSTPGSNPSTPGEEGWEKVEGDGNEDGAGDNGEKGEGRDVVTGQFGRGRVSRRAGDTVRNRDWKGFVGFFHPFCNAGGGGERVLWAAVKSTQQRWPNAVCVVYTGDHDATKAVILERVQSRFNINLHRPTVIFIYLSTRHYVHASMYPHFTLLGQSLGSLVLAYDAFSLLVPDIFIDTMGYAFTLAFSKFCFPDVPTGAYVHYPTISTDMLGSLDAEVSSQGLNAGAGKGWKGSAKKKYWHLFARSYSRVGGTVDVVMTNSSWTQSHIQTLWGPQRTRRRKSSNVELVYPPTAVEEMVDAIEISEASEKSREKVLLYIAQFRPEKNHSLVIQAFARFVHDDPTSSADSKLVLIGSVRDSDDATRVYELRLLAHELRVKDRVEFICDASFPEILKWLGKSWIGVNGMWNEHFGIGVVEYQAAGLISVVNDSGGPKQDIVVEFEGGKTGFHASTAEEYAVAFGKAFEMSPEETLETRRRARSSSKRFTEEAFAVRWAAQLEKLIGLTTP
ncbi:asparagine-linked glycosylation protein [Agyrium rufum]|nr:asparagine-linked glycosylation protein [Agyrium rufum]